MKLEEVCVLLSTVDLDEYWPFSMGALSRLEFLHCLDLSRVINHEHYVPAMSIQCILQRGNIGDLVDRDG